MASLAELEKSGTNVTDSFSASDQLPQMPCDFDQVKFNRGRKFFQNNFFSCTMAMLLSLINGLSISNLLEPLVFTEQSKTPGKAIRRYLKTFHHVVLWHFGDVLDTSSSAHKSIAEVRRMHSSVARKMMEQQDAESEENGTLKKYVSQYDMSLVQYGFMGLIVMYPGSFGISCSRQDISDYCYFWYGIGYLLGISDENNICSAGLQETRNICHEIEDNVLLPSLRDPPGQFYPMAKALIDGMNSVSPCPFFSVEASVAILLSVLSAKYPKLTLADKVRLLVKQGLMFAVQYIPFCRTLLNRLFRARLNELIGNMVNLSLNGL